MLRVLLVLAAVAVCSNEALGDSESNMWPFKMVDHYVTEFKESIDSLKKSALNHEHQEQKVVKEVYEDVKPAKQTYHYDFIIVGGGTSGSVLANRLSEIPEWKILLLEAGGDETDATRVPRNWPLLQNTPHNWGYYTVPQNYSCLALPGHKCPIPVGRILGGTSSINSMLYTRGNPRDYDSWADQENKGWCFSDVLPVLKKIEDAHFEPFDKKYHHQGGPLHLQNPQFHTHLAELALASGEELGYHVIDYNGEHQIGIAIPQLTTKCGKRVSTNSAYLAPTHKRENLVVKPLSQVTRILISPHTKEAQGVEFVHEGKLYVAKAEKEVILAAGALNTPKLLILSGVGPKEHCEKLGIDHILDLKVGYNLKIRPTFVGLDFLVKHNISEDDHHHVDVRHGYGSEHKHDHDHELSHDHEHHSDEHEHSAKDAHDHAAAEGGHDEYEDIVHYLKYGKGPLTSPGIDALAYIRTNYSKDPKTYPDIELKFLSTPMKDGHKTFKIVVTLNHPKSKGCVKLHSKDPLHPPLIDPQMLSDEDKHDIHSLLEGIHVALKLAKGKAFEKLGVTLVHKPVHGCEETEFGSDEYWACALKYCTLATEDASGTARMGQESDGAAVVDNKLQVHGAHKLRVADASVIPVPFTGNFIAPSIVIGEKAAHIIKEHWLS